jgi:hypothetical protein
LLDAKKLLDELGKFEQIFRGKQKTVWSNSPEKSWSSDVSGQLSENIKQLYQAVKFFQKAATRLRELFGIEPTKELAVLDKFQPAIAHVVAVPLVPKGWPQGTNLHMLRKVFNELKTNIDSIQTISSALNAKYILEFFTWDLPQLRKLRERYRRYRGICRWLRRDYRRDRGHLCALRKEKNRVADKELIADIEQAIQWKEILNQLEDRNHPARRAFGLLFNAEMPNLNDIERVCSRKVICY